MACSAIRYPLLRNPKVRHYAVAATQAKTSVSSSATPESKVLGNKIIVSAIDNNSPVAHVAIAFRAGSRNETYETQGASHVLRAVAGLCSNRASYFGITRNIQQLGGNLIVSSDREMISYTLQVARNNLENALCFLEDVATRPVLKPWEVSDQSPRIRYHISTVPETARVIELLHKAAYRRGLGYSIYCPKRNIGVIDSETIKYFINNWFTGNKCAVVGAGMPMSVLSKFAEGLPVSSSNANVEPAKYAGGEIRKERNSELTHVAMAVESVGLDKEKEALAYAILQQAVGTGPRVKWGTGSAPLTKALEGVANDLPFAVSAFNASYSDSGLFGFVLCSSRETISALTKTAFKWLKSPKVTDADICRGKAELKSSILFATESNQGMVDNLVHQNVLKGKVTCVSTIVAEIDKISTADVQSAAKKLASGKVSMAAIGDLKTVPYLDEF